MSYKVFIDVNCDIVTFSTLENIYAVSYSIRVYDKENKVTSFKMKCMDSKEMIFKNGCYRVSVTVIYKKMYKCKCVKYHKYKYFDEFNISKKNHMNDIIDVESGVIYTAPQSYLNSYIDVYADNSVQVIPDNTTDSEFSDFLIKLPDGICGEMITIANHTLNNIKLLGANTMNEPDGKYICTLGHAKGGYSVGRVMVDADVYTVMRQELNKLIGTVTQGKYILVDLQTTTRIGIRFNFENLNDELNNWVRVKSLDDDDNAWENNPTPNRTEGWVAYYIKSFLPPQFNYEENEAIRIDRHQNNLPNVVKLERINDTWVVIESQILFLSHKLP